LPGGRAGMPGGFVNVGGNMIPYYRLVQMFPELARAGGPAGGPMGTRSVLPPQLPAPFKVSSGPAAPPASAPISTALATSQTGGGGAESGRPETSATSSPDRGFGGPVDRDRSSQSEEDRGFGGPVDRDRSSATDSESSGRSDSMRGGPTE